MANEEQREAWNGESGVEWTRRQEQFDGMLAPWIEVLTGAAQVRPGERVLDLGCGCGATTREVARLCGPAGTAVGVDLSAMMIDRARSLAERDGVGNARFEVGDCQVDELPGSPHDVAVSRFGVMFFDDPVAAFANVGRAMAPGGRLAVLTWAPLAQQDWITLVGAAAAAHVALPDLGGDGDGGPGIFSLADRERITGVLEAAGWRDVEVRAHRRPVLVAGGGSVEQALEFLLATAWGRALMAAAPDEGTAGRVVDAVRATLEAHLTPRGVELAGVALASTATRPR